MGDAEGPYPARREKGKEQGGGVSALSDVRARIPAAPYFLARKKVTVCYRGWLPGGGVGREPPTCEHLEGGSDGLTASRRQAASSPPAHQPFLLTLLRPLFVPQRKGEGSACLATSENALGCGSWALAAPSESDTQTWKQEWDLAEPAGWKEHQPSRFLRHSYLPRSAPLRGG